MNAAARCCVWYLLARFMRTLAEEPACGPEGCYELLQCWGIHTDEYPFRCDYKTDGGGWTILQQRRNSNFDFYRSCADYKRGFGSGDTFWLGLEKLYRMTVGQPTQFHVELHYGRFDSVMYAEFDNVTIGDEAHDYALNYAVYNGKGRLEDGFRGNIGRFCCRDHRDSDFARRAMYMRTGWWFGNHPGITSDLNSGLRANVQRQSVYWVGMTLDIHKTQIKFRPMSGAKKPKCDRSCPHGGTCQRAANGTFLCRCAFARMGRRCEEIDYDSVPDECFCFRGGWCTSVGLCSCRPGYTGMRCLKKSSMAYRKGKPDSRWVRLERTCR